MTRQPIRWGLYAALSLFLLRLAVGWHFFSAGAEKLKNPNFRSSWFLEAAVGPLAGYFHSLIPDALGEQRLDLGSRRTSWTVLKDTLATRLGDDAKSETLDEVLEKNLGKLDYFEKENGPDIEQHLLEVKRYRAAVDEPGLTGVDFGRAWLKTKRNELRAGASGWVNDLNQLDEDYRNEIIAASGVGNSTVESPPDLSGKNWVDHAVTWTLLVAGGLLMVGFLTPLAALVAGGFLFTVLLTQPFWVSEADLSYFPYQLVELAALFVLITTKAGRCGGLDYFFNAFRWRRASAEMGID